MLSNGTVNRAGRVIGPRVPLFGQVMSYHASTHELVIPGAGACHIAVPGSNTFSACAQRLGVHGMISYLPPSRYWPLQGVETAICLAIAVALAALSVWWVLHRIA